MQKANEEILKLLKEATALFVSSVYSVHVQTKQSRALAAYLKGEETEKETQEGAGRSFAQQAVGGLNYKHTIGNDNTQSLFFSIISDSSSQQDVIYRTST